MKFTVDFTVTAEWVDKRLTWNDLKHDHYLNMPSYLDSMGYNRTSTLYANSSGPRISKIRPTAAW